MLQKKILRSITWKILFRLNNGMKFELDTFPLEKH